MRGGPRDSHSPSRCLSGRPARAPAWKVPLTFRSGDAQATSCGKSTQGSSGRPPRPAASGSGPCCGARFEGAGGGGGDARTRLRASGREGPGAPSRGVAASGQTRGSGARRQPGVAGRSARSLGRRRPSAGKSPRLARPSAARESKGRSGKTSPSAVPAGRRAEQRPSEAEAHFLGRPLPRTGWVFGLCSLHNTAIRSFESNCLGVIWSSLTGN